MHNRTTNKTASRSLTTRVLTMLLIVVMLVQSMAFGVSAMASAMIPSAGKAPSTGVSGIATFDSDEVIAELKRDLIKSLNKDLVKKVSDYELTGPVDVLITFSDESIVTAFTSSPYANIMTLKEFRNTDTASRLESAFSARQTEILDRLFDDGVIDRVKYTYLNIMDGACVSTTYEQLTELASFEGIERVMLANKYEPAAAVTNPVDVYDTGIFNSSDVSYTGKKTIVAVLDTGCDYNHSAFTTHVVESPLYDREDIASMLDKTMAAGFTEGLEAREVYYGNITGGKIAFGYDYADKDPDIMPFENSHGTHVAGIIAGKDDNITGVAVDAQLAIMKVFSDYEQGAEDEDILAALEDSIILGVDAINMSLGSSCGFSREVDEEYKNTLYDNIEKAGISLVVAASNDYSSGFGAEDGNTNKTDNPDSATIGSPASYSASLAVASINGEKDRYMLANGDKVIFYNDSYNMASDEYDFFEMLGIRSGEPVEYEYVTVPGVGMAVNYAGLDVEGKIALVQRGDITFEEKVQFAQEAGAIAVVIYNNVVGDIRMTIGNFAKIPAVSIGKDDGDMLASQPSGKIVFDLDNLAGPFMSDFSSWGPTPDLSLKPEITAHGGNIYSATVGGEYEKMSGTSMASPNMCGITVLIRQYVKEKYPEYTAPEVRDMVNQLTMSTATIALDRNGNPYSPRKQGAGIADIAKSTTTPAYLYVDGIGKTKLELRDDPNRTGVYTMSINVKNISDAPLSYRLGNITMTESISVSEPEYVAEMAYMLSPSATYQAVGGTLEDGVLTVAGGQTAKVTVTLTLSKEDKAYINSTFANGMYVEGFLTFDNIAEGGIDLNAPFLAFYGDWGEAPLFDLDYYEVETEAHNNAIDDDDKIKADYYATTPLGTYYYDYIIPLGSYVYKMDESEYTPIPATREHAAVSYYADSISGIYGVFAGLLRGAKEMNIQVVDTSTGEVVWEDVEYNCYKSHYRGAPGPYVSKFDLMMADPKTGEIFGNNNAKYEVTMSAKLDWDGEGANDSDTYSFSFYVDYQAPSVVDATYRTEYDKGRKENRYYLDLMIYDNHYAMACRPIVVYEIFDEKDQEMKRTYSSLCDSPIPVYQEERDSTSKVTIEITDYIDLISESSMPNGVSIYLEDFAMNSSVSYIPFPETDSRDLEFENPEIEIDINETCDLTKLLMHKDSADPVETDYLKTLKWYIKDDTGVVALKNGLVEGLKTGTAIVMVTSDSWVTPNNSTGQWVNVPIYKTLVVNVTDTVMEDDPLSGERVPIDGLKFTYYETLFAFNSDIDYSEIGITGTTNYFGTSTSLAFYPSEQIKLHYQLDPWNIADHRYELIWSSSNPNVATVDDEGVVTGQSEGKARITLNIKIDDKTSLIAARLTAEIKSEFIIENRTLVAYKGRGGEVIIPDDEGIMTIGSFAFSHFDLDNEKEVEKDENGYYDMDEKKEPLGNDTVTSVVIPENVETIEKYAFYNCTALSEVTLPTSCKLINEYAFYGCSVLESVNFDHVKVVGDYAFYGCESLSCEKLPGGPNLSAIYSVGDYGFAKTRFESLDLSGLSRMGVGIFSDCSKLYEVTLGKRTRVMAKMFANTALESITVYGDIIEDNAFEGCDELKSVTVVNDLTYLGDSAFYGCRELESFTANGVIEQIGGYAFYGCRSLEEFTLPDCSVAIGDGVFANTKLNTLNIGENTVIESLGFSVFENITGLTVNINAASDYKLVDGMIYTADGKTLVLVLPTTSLITFTVPAEVTKISDGAFSSLTRLNTVKFAEGSQLAEIGNNAFANCSLLLSVVLPERDITVGDYAFYGTTSLRTCDLRSVTSVGDYAFSGSNLEAVVMEKENVTIGEAAFYMCSALRTVSLGKNAVIGASAFEQSGVRTVTLLGDTTVDTGAFFACTQLSSFDFEDLVGRIGDFAFYGCTSLTSVNAPKVTELGRSAFSDCYALRSFSAENVKVVGINCFAPLSENAQYANVIKTVYMPALEVVGDYAFYGCMSLTAIDLSNATDIGSFAFGVCTALKEVILSENVKEIPECAFYSCSALESIDLSSVERIGLGAFYNVTLPKDLRLDKVTFIDASAFMEPENEQNLESVYAPELTYVGDQAFAGCMNLAEFYAPKLETIGSAALAYTSLTELEVSSAMKEIGVSAFEGCESFIGFFSTVADENGDKKKEYTIDLGAVMLEDGALYRAIEDGYELVCFPAGKDVKEVTVADGTSKIGFAAFYNNAFIEKVVLPASLKYISNFAFYGCDSLATVEFNSYYAPVIEGSLHGNAIEINPDNIEDYPGFDLLYRYDYTYKKISQLGYVLYYANFKGSVGSKDAQDMTAVLPENHHAGYDSLIYRAFFTFSEENTGVTAGKYAVDFIEAAKKLPEVVDRFDKLVVDNAIIAYNALLSHSDELKFVEEEYISRYNIAVSQYAVDVVEDKIAHLFDIDASKYSFDMVKDANVSFLALTAEERESVENKEVLDAKIAALAAALDTELDFTKEYEDHVKAEDPIPDPEPPADNDGGLDTWVIVLIAVLGAVLVGGGAAVAFIIVKKKRRERENEN